MTVRTRFAPSPTGFLHLGNMRIALFNALFAKKNNGVFILRIEDTDQVRSQEQYHHALQVDLKWLGLEWQEGPTIGGDYAPYAQSQRQDIYANYYQQLENNHFIYPCFCTDQELLLMRNSQLSRGLAPRYAGTCKALTTDRIEKNYQAGKKPAWRFAVPANQTITFVDLVKGTQTFQSNEIGDFIVRRQDGTASFLFCNAIDDAVMNISHIFRGEDHLTNTAKQVFILKMLGLPIPFYGHLSLIVGHAGAPLSKRQGDRNIQTMREQGYLPSAIVNYLARLGHTMADQQHLLSLEALASHFEPQHLSRSSSAFDPAQLRYWQTLAVQSLDETHCLSWLGQSFIERLPSTKRQAFIHVIKANILFPEDAQLWLDIFFSDSFVMAKEAIPILQETDATLFQQASEVMTLQADWQTALKQLQMMTPLKGKQLLMPLRIALTGQIHGPALQDIVVLLGQEETKARFIRAAHYVNTV